MNSWFLQQCDVDAAFVQNPDSVTYHFETPQFIYYGLPIVAILGAFIFWRQRRNLRSAPLSLTISLTACRVVVLALLVVVLASPFVRRTDVAEKKPIVAILFDDSQSMGLASGPFDKDEETLRKLAIASGYQISSSALDPSLRTEFNNKTRAKLVQNIVQAQKAQLLEPLAKKYELRFYRFAREAKPLIVDTVKWELPEPQTDGSGTQIADAVLQVIGEAAGRPVAGLILFSDGESTGGQPLTKAAEECMAKATPLFAVPAGSKAKNMDVSIVDLSTAGQVTLGDTARVGVVIQSTQFDGRTVTVELFDGNTLLDTKEIALRSAEQQQVEMAFVAKQPGSRILSVNIKPFDDEPQKENNRDMTLLRVSDEKIKVLYIEGLPRWDFRFLKNAMRRDQGLAGQKSNQPEIVLETEWRRLPEADKAKALPQTIEELSAYHTVILGDASSKLLNDRFLSLLNQAVKEKGVGLLIEAGPYSMPHGLGNKIADLLPVQLDVAPGGLLAPTARLFRLELTPDGSLNDCMKLYDDTGRNQSAWSQMLPYSWCIGASRAQPGATVLAWNPMVENSYGKMPVISHHLAGKGRAMLVGMDSTWLWRQNVADRFFYKFWGQSIRFVARKDDTKKKKSTIEISPVPPRVKERVELDLYAYTQAGTPVQQDKLSVEVVGPGYRETVTAERDPDNKGHFKGALEFPALGDYRLNYGTGTGLDAAELTVSVRRSPEELRVPFVNRAKLKQLAESTPGGQMLELSDEEWAKKIVTAIEKSQFKTRREENQRTHTIWDNWIVLALLVGVYSLDIALRRMAGLS